MQKVKILVSSSAQFLEDKINEFLKKQNNILDITFIISPGYTGKLYASNIKTEYQALIWYT